ncbi:MAG: hypothetical protein IJZ53_02295 [Tyzzerella sp.]|nr:hypothetical protein [Tyzzerella sp.]
MVKEKLRAKILDGSLQDYKTYLAGCYRGYHIVIEFRQPYYIVTINASSTNDANNEMLREFLAQHKGTVKKLAKAEANTHKVSLSVAAPNLQKNLPDVLNNSIAPIINYLVNGNYTSGCENCGDTMQQLHCYEINGLHHYICDTCAKEIEASLQEKQVNIKMQKSQFIPGLIGAFLGSLLGAALWILIYRLGYIAGLAGAVTAICALKGYEMFGKHLDKKGVICSVIIMVAMIFFANKIAWSWEAFDALKDYGYTFSNCFRYLGDILEASGLTGSYYGDLGIGYFLTLICSIGNIINAFKTSAGSYSMKKM